MKYQILFSRKNKKNTINISSAEFAHNMVSVRKMNRIQCLPNNLHSANWCYTTFLLVVSYNIRVFSGRVEEGN